MDHKFVKVQRSFLDHLLQHCWNCQHFDGQLEGFVDGQVVKILSRRPGPASSEQNPPQALGRSQVKITNSTADAALTWFLKHAPKATTWRARQIELGLQTAEQYEKVIQAFGHVAGTRREAFDEMISSGDHFVDLAERLALLIGSSFKDADLQKSATRFKTLVLLSYCEVLQKRGVAFKTIDRIIGHVGAHEEDRKKILRGALWINGIINKLVDSGWTIFRATELFFLNALARRYLSRIRNKKNVTALLSHLTADDFLGHDYSDCLGPKYTIPGLIASVVSSCDGTTDHISLDEICDALGYPVDRVPRSSWSICLVRATSTNAPATAPSANFENLDASSFGTSNLGTSSRLDEESRTVVPNANPSHQVCERRWTEHNSDACRILESQRHAHFGGLNPRSLRTSASVPVTSSQSGVCKAPSRLRSLHSQHRTIFNQIQLTSSQKPPKPTDPVAVLATASPPHVTFSAHASTRATSTMNQQGIVPISSYATVLLPLFHAMGDRIPKILFDRAVTSQRRIDMHGKSYQVTLEAVGIDKDLVDLLTEEVFKQVVDYLISWSRISLHDGIYFCQDESTQASFGQRKDYWSLQAFMLCCYVFPRGPAVDSSGSSGRQLLNPLRHTLHLLNESGRDLPTGKETVETLLCASKFERLSDRENLLALATRQQLNPTESHIHAQIVYETSVTLRSRGQISDSERIITEFLNSQRFVSNDYSRYFLGSLNLSQAYNRIYEFDFLKAREESGKWRPSSNDTLPDGELHLLCNQLRTTGRVLRGEGRFDEARSCFEGCISTPGLPKSKRSLVICHLSDVYCELEYMQRIADPIWESQPQYLSKRREIIEREIEHERASNQHPKSLRRLLLSLTEITIRQARFDKAKSSISELLNMYGAMVEPDIDDKVGHVRTLISRARISLLHEAEHNWTAALLQNRSYNPFEKEVFTCGVIYLFISLIRFQCGNGDGSQDMFKKAAEVIGRERPQFLMPGLGTYLFDHVRLELKSVAGFVLPEIAC